MFSIYINFGCDSVECGNFQSLNWARLHKYKFYIWGTKQYSSFSFNPDQLSFVVENFTGCHCTAELINDHLRSLYLLREEK